MWNTINLLIQTLTAGAGAAFRWTAFAVRGLRSLLLQAILGTTLVFLSALVISFFTPDRSFLLIVGLLLMIVPLSILLTRRALHGAGLLLAADAVRRMVRGRVAAAVTPSATTVTTMTQEMAFLQFFGKVVFYVTLVEMLILFAVGISPGWVSWRISVIGIFAFVLWLLLGTPWGIGLRLPRYVIPVLAGLAVLMMLAPNVVQRYRLTLVDLEGAQATTAKYEQNLRVKAKNAIERLDSRIVQLKEKEFNGTITPVESQELDNILERKAYIEEQVSVTPSWGNLYDTSRSTSTGLAWFLVIALGLSALSALTKDNKAFGYFTSLGWALLVGWLIMGVLLPAYQYHTRDPYAKVEKAIKDASEVMIEGGIEQANKTNRRVLAKAARGVASPTEEGEALMRYAETGREKIQNEERAINHLYGRTKGEVSIPVTTDVDDEEPLSWFDTGKEICGPTRIEVWGSATHEPPGHALHKWVGPLGWQEATPEEEAAFLRYSKVYRMLVPGEPFMAALGRLGTSGTPFIFDERGPEGRYQKTVTPGGGCHRLYTAVNGFTRLYNWQTGRLGIHLSDLARQRIGGFEMNVVPLT